MLGASYPSRYRRAIVANRLVCDTSERVTSFAGPCFFQYRCQWRSRAQLTLASAARMRSGAHRLTGVGGVPGETKSVPSPSRSITC